MEWKKGKVRKMNFVIAPIKEVSLFQAISNLKWCIALLENKEITNEINKYIQGYLEFNKNIIAIYEELK